ncbi:MAG: hypothetical protein MHPSP_003526, partial [Paramarteilia canceri]
LLSSKPSNIETESLNDHDAWQIERPENDPDRVRYSVKIGDSPNITAEDSNRYQNPYDESQNQQQLSPTSMSSKTTKTQQGQNHPLDNDENIEEDTFSVIVDKSTADSTEVFGQNSHYNQRKMLPFELDFKNFAIIILLAIILCYFVKESLNKNINFKFSRCCENIFTRGSNKYDLSNSKSTTDPIKVQSILSRKSGIIVSDTPQMNLQKIQTKISIPSVDQITPQPPSYRNLYPDLSTFKEMNKEDNVPLPFEMPQISPMQPQIIKFMENADTQIGDSSLSKALGNLGNSTGNSNQWVTVEYSPQVKNFKEVKCSNCQNVFQVPNENLDSFTVCSEC